MSISARPKTAILAAVIASEVAEQPLEILWNGKVTTPTLSFNGTEIVGTNEIAKYFIGKVHSGPECEAWLVKSSKVEGKTPFKDLQVIAADIEKDLKAGGKGFLVIDKVCLADVVVFGSLKGNSIWNNMIKKGAIEKQFPETAKWFNSLNDAKYVTAACEKVFARPVANKEDKKEKNHYAELPGAKMGEVVVRFPPEASGFLHIGHAKAAILNYVYAQQYKGKLIMRFDDTNPDKEKGHFEESILEDLKTLGVTYDMKSHTSDFFDKMLELAEKMIKDSKAYVDDTDVDKMRQERMDGIESLCRGNSVEKNLSLWQEMVNGTEKGVECCLRAKIDMQEKNKCMRDPVIYRCNSTPHLRTGTKYKVYPTYDFACPIVDSLEGITHVLRTNEYRDRKPQFEWMCQALGLRVPIIHDYSRLNMMYTVMSKRKLTWFVEKGYVDGWTDPRFPTVKGIIRRGLTVDGLKQFIMEQGASRSDNLMEWDKIWATNKNVIDSTAPRYMALEKEKAVKVILTNGPSEPYTKNIAKHPKNKAIGEKQLSFSKEILIEGDDAAITKEGEKVTLNNWGNCIITKVDLVNKIFEGTIKEDDKDFKDTRKLNWVSSLHVPAVGAEFDHLITKRKLEDGDVLEDILTPQTRFDTNLLCEPATKDLKEGDIIQFVRRGYFRVDSHKDGNLVLFNIPDGRQSHVSTLSTKTASAAAHRDPQASGSGKSKKQLKKEAEEAKKVAAAESASAPEPEFSGEKLAQKNALDAKIKEQGELIRSLKSKKEPVEEAVAKLLALKAEYKAALGVEYKPSQPARQEKKKASQPGTASPQQKKKVTKEEVAIEDLTGEAKELAEKITAQGGKVKELKMNKQSDPEETKAAVSLLLTLKADFEKMTGKSLKPTQAPREKKPKENKPKAPKEQVVKKAGKQEQPGMTCKKEEDFSEWYLEVIKKSELVSAYPVTGCFVLRPNAFSIWEYVTEFLDKKFKATGVENCYFPMFVRSEAITKEAEQFDDFQPEIAWVTKCGTNEFAEPIGIRPTSEAVMYPSVSDWVSSHRDLPLKLNQWCNIVRWEFKDAVPFLRTREFLWQEGHCAHENKAGADEEAHHILGFYEQCYSDLMAVPVMPGKKSEKEKFAGGLYTTTVEGFIPSVGRGIQGATSHNLGQNFSTIFDVKYKDAKGETQHAWQTSWGYTTRSIGVMVMTHSDDTGLVLPPRVASKQVVLVPCGLAQKATEADKNTLFDKVKEVEKQLKAAGVRAHSDLRDHLTPGRKFNYWEIRGVPIRLELGPRDLEKGTAMCCIRFSGEKRSVQLSTIAEEIPKILTEIHDSLFTKANKVFRDNIKVFSDWNEFVPNLDNRHLCLVPWCERVACEEDIKKNSTRATPHPTLPSMGAKSLCIPFEKDQPELKAGQKCIRCDQPAVQHTLFGRSY